MFFNLFSSTKRDFIETITEASSIEAIAEILKKADKYYTKLQIIPLGHQFNKSQSDISLTESNLGKIQKAAISRSVDIILQQHDLLTSSTAVADMKATLESAVTDIDLDLFSKSQLLSLLATSAIERTHNELKEFIAAIPTWPAIVFKLTPSLSKFFNPHNDEQIANDGLLDMLPFANTEGRRKIMENFKELAAILGEHETNTNSFAIQCIRESFPNQAATIFGTVTKEKPGAPGSRPIPTVQ